MRKCSYCGIENSDPASQCKECGTGLATEPPVLVAEQLRQLRGKIAAELSGLRKPGGLIVAVAGLAAAAAFFVQSGRLADARRELQQVKARLPDLEPLQGYWEGEGVGGKCSVTITGDSLHFSGYQGDRTKPHWYKSTFTLLPGTDPQQLRATIKEGSGHVGSVIFAIFKIEDGTLTLAADEGSGEPPKTFSMASGALFSLKRRIASNPKSTEPKTP